MTDKRSPHPGLSPSSKRARTFPLAKDEEIKTSDEVKNALGRRATVLGSEEDNLSPEDGPSEASESRSEASPTPTSHNSHHSVNGNENDLQALPEPKSSFSRNPEETQDQAACTLDSTTPNGEAGLHPSSPPLSQSEPRELSQDQVHVQYWDDFDPDAPRSPSAATDLEQELGPWSPPPEPLRPSNPYKKGQKLEIRKHKACPPFGEDYPNYPDVRDYAAERDLWTKTLVEICLQYPPMEGETAWDEPPRNLHIVDKIRVRDDAGAQLVVCRLDEEPHEYAAKIYDPLYYGFADRLWSGKPRDVADEADKDYCREVAAYLEINDQLGGKEIPKYYGSWTFQMPLDLPDARKMRDVRMILLERIKGGTMSEMEPSTYPEEVRLGALAQIMESFSRVTFAGVRHGDIAQRNVMLCDEETAKTLDRVVLIDFNYATVSRLDNFELLHGERSKKRPDKPINPIDLWWDTGSFYSKFWDWCPARWKLQRRPMREWMYERWGKSEEFLPHNEPLDWTDY